MIDSRRTEILTFNSPSGPTIKKPRLALQARTKEFPIQPSSKEPDTQQTLEPPINMEEKSNDGDDIVDSLRDIAGKSWMDVLHSRCKGTNNSRLSATTATNQNQDLQDTRANLSCVGRFCPEWDEFYLAVCDICGIIIKPQALENHLASKHQIGNRKLLESDKTRTIILCKNSNGDKQDINGGSFSNFNTGLTQPRSQTNNSDLLSTTLPNQVIVANSLPIAITLKASTTITATSATNTLPISSITTPRTHKQYSTTKIDNNKSDLTTQKSQDVAANPTREQVKQLKQQQNSTKGDLKQTQRSKQNTNQSGINLTANQNSLSIQRHQSQQEKHNQRDSFFSDPSFYGLEPLSPPVTYNQSTLTVPTNSSSSLGQSSSPSSSASSTSSPQSSGSTFVTNNQHLMNLAMVNPLSQSRTIMHTPSQATKFRCQVDRKWRNTYNVLRDAFL